MSVCVRKSIISNRRIKCVYVCVSVCVHVSVRVCVCVCVYFSYKNVEIYGQIKCFSKTNLKQWSPLPFMTRELSSFTNPMAKEKFLKGKHNKKNKIKMRRAGITKKPEALTTVLSIVT